MLCPMEALHPFDREAVRANTFDMGTHTYQ